MIFRIRTMLPFKRQLGQKLVQWFIRVQRNLRQPCRTERRADIASRTIVQLQPADIGKHLPPVAASRTAAN